MKHIFTRSLMLLLALTWIIPKANAQSYAFKVNDQSDWWIDFSKQSEFPGTNYIQAAVTDDAIFTVPTGGTAGDFHSLSNGTIFVTKGYKMSSTKLENWSGGNDASIFTTGYTGTHTAFFAGPQIAADAEGTLFITADRGTDWTDKNTNTYYDAYKSTAWAGTAEALMYYTSRPYNGSAGTRRQLLLGSYKPSGRADVMSAYGQCINGTGYLWFVPGVGSIIDRITISKGIATAKVQFDAPEAATGNRGYVMQYTSDKVMYVNTTNNSASKVWKGTISGSSITWEDTGLASYSSQATMFVLGGCEFIAYSKTDQIVEIYNLTEKKAVTSFNPFGKTSTQSYNKHTIHAKVSGTTANIYIYVPGVAAAKYTMIAAMVADPAQNVVASIVKDQDATQLGRQDAVITWTAPATGTPTGYTVYYSTKYIDATTNAYTDWSNWTKLETVGANVLTYTHKDVKWTNVPQECKYKYNIVVNYASSIGHDAESNEVTPEFIPFTPKWLSEWASNKVDLKNYDGYCKVQLYWYHPTSTYGIQPNDYSILRNGVVIAENIAAFNYIDKTCMPNQTYKYEIVSHYKNHEATAKSTAREATIGVRDWAKPSYKIEEVYNYPIGLSTATGEVVKAGADYANFTSTARYKQAAFVDGYWYVAQNHDGTTNGNSGIIKISAATPFNDPYLDDNYNATENILTGGTKIYSGAKESTTGIAADYGGNLFIQHKSLRKPYDGAEADQWLWILYKGKIFLKNDDGSYPADGIEVTFDDASFNLDEFKGESWVSGQTVPGRVDYFTMSGDLKKSGVAYLYIAPSVTRAVYVIQLRYNGSTITATKRAYYDDHSIADITNKPFSYANENYAFPINVFDRELDFMHLIRSNAYSAHTMTTSVGGQSKRLGTVYDTFSRVNNAGGCSLEFNGECMIITPQNQYSINTGNFYVGMAERKNFQIDNGDGTIDTYTQTAAEADLTSIIPIVQWNQDAEQNSGYSDANCISLYAEVSKRDLNLDGIANDEAFIYMYVPGVRFAKYRLTPSSLFPPTPVNLTVDPVYANNQYDQDIADGAVNPGGDIEQFNASASWYHVPNYGSTSDGNQFYEIESYTMNITDPTGEITFPELVVMVDDNGNIESVTYGGVAVANSAIKVDKDDSTAQTITLPDGSIFSVNMGYDAAGNKVPQYSYIYHDVDKDVTYLAEVTVNYNGIDGVAKGVKYSSEKTEWEDINTYAPVAPTGVVDVERYTNWADWNGNDEGKVDENADLSTTDPNMDPDDGYWYNYTVSMDLNNPEFGDDREEPRTYYYLTTDLDGDGQNDDIIEDFYLYDPTNPNADEKTGYVHITDGKIPGDYDFDAVHDGNPDIYWTESDYVGYNPNGSGELNPKLEGDPTTNPSDRTYVVNAVYAGGNERIKEEAKSNMTQDDITTEVEIIEAANALSAYPIPAQASVTIKSPEAIESVEFINAAGLVVKQVAGEGETIMTVNVSDLAAGYYFLRVNDLAPIKMMKK